MASSGENQEWLTERFSIVKGNGQSVGQQSSIVLNPSGAVTTAWTGVVTLVNCFLQGNDQGPAIYNAGYIKTINCVITNNYEGVRSWGSGADFINTTFVGNRNFALAVSNDVQLYNLN